MRSSGFLGLKKMPNEKIRRRMSLEISITEEVKQRRLKWFGHITEWELNDGLSGVAMATIL